jgi:hypothetical protein
MNHSLEACLKYNSWWRDFGTIVLLVAVLFEFLIDIFWLEKPEFFPLLRGRKATTPLLKWYRHLLTPRGWIVLVVGLSVFAGIFLEIWYGTKVDDINKQWRIQLLAAIRPRSLGEADRKEIADACRKFAGDVPVQVIRTNGPQGLSLGLDIWFALKAGDSRSGNLRFHPHHYTKSV